MNESELEKKRFKIPSRYYEKITKGKREIETKYEIGENVHIYRPGKNKMGESWQGGWCLKNRSRRQYSQKREKKYVEVKSTSRENFFSVKRCRGLLKKHVKSLPPNIYMN